MNQISKHSISNKNRVWVSILIITSLMVAILVFSNTGLYNDKIDTEIYVNQISGFALDNNIHDEPLNVAARLFKPLYGVVGSWFYPYMHPYNFMLSLNLLFFFGLAITTFFFLIELGFKKELATVGSIWVIASYPMFKYGLALSTDISGWLFTVLTMFVFLKSLHSEKINLVVIASLIGFIGSLAKETGVLGLIFCGVYILMQRKKWDKFKLFKYLVALCLPFFILQGLLNAILFFYSAPTFLDWYSQNTSTYMSSYRKIYYVLGVELSTFNIMIPFAAIGLYYAYKIKDIFKHRWLKIYAPLFFVSLPIFMWPILISRIAFIQFVFVVPLALYGIQHIFNRYIDSPKKSKVIKYVIYSLPPIISLTLFLISGGGSLFDIIRNYI